MAVTFRHVETAAYTDNVTTYTTGTLTFNPNRLIYLAVVATVGAGATTAAPTITGLGLTWSVTKQTPQTDGLKTLYWLRATTGSTAPSPGALTITFPVSLVGAGWTIHEIDGANLNAAGVQSVDERLQGGTNTSISFPFLNPITPGNGAIAVVVLNVNDTINPGPSWTAGGATAAHVTPSVSIRGMYSSAPPLNIEASWATQGNTWVIGEEIAASSAQPSPSLMRVGGTVAGFRVGGVTPSGIYVGTVKVWP